MRNIIDCNQNLIGVYFCYILDLQYSDLFTLQM
jgi:hypothetical protein